VSVTAFIRPFLLISRLYISIGIQKIQVGGKCISTIIPFKLRETGICNLQISLRYTKPAPQLACLQGYTIIWHSIYIEFIDYPTVMLNSSYVQNGEMMELNGRESYAWCSYFGLSLLYISGQNAGADREFPNPPLSDRVREILR
jgi:hypothetical protein